MVGFPVLPGHLRAPAPMVQTVAPQVLVSYWPVMTMATVALDSFLKEGDHNIGPQIL